MSLVFCVDKCDQEFVQQKKLQVIKVIDKHWPNVVETRLAARQGSRVQATRFPDVYQDSH